MKTINKKTLESMIDCLDKNNTPGWLFMLRDFYGQEVYDYAEEYITEEDNFYHREEKLWNNLRPTLLAKIKELKEENKGFAKEIQRMKEEELKKEFSARKITLEKMIESPGKIEKKEIASRELKRINSLINSKITNDMIQKAEEYPIENIIEVQKHWAICPFHNDKNPSMYCKNNYYYCFSCGESGNVINLYRYLNSCSFVQAIKKLQ